jgi:YHS domain-containing protein
MNLKSVVFTGALAALALSSGISFGASWAQTAASPQHPILVAQSTSQPQIEYFADKGIAIRGTDPVAYFRQGKPIQGSAEFAHDWQGVTWHFSSAENRDLFARDPEKFAPQYGGFCAYAVSQGYTAPIDPDAWKIIDGKLYLNFDKKVQKLWEQDIPGFISKANANWPGVLAK